MKQDDLFGNEARELRDEGMQRAALHADEIHGGLWVCAAYNALLEFLRFGNEPFTAEDVRAFAVLVAEPPDRRAWGAVLCRAARAGLIRKIGYRTHRDPVRHNGISTLWRKA